MFRVKLVLGIVAFLAATNLATSPADVAERRVSELMKTTSIPGMSVAVMVKDEIVWSRGFGTADLENKIAVTPNTRFRLASVSKLITAAAVARLVDSGKLDLDAPISKYINDLPESLGKVTSRQLAGHLAGVRHYQQKDFVPVSIDNKNYTTVESSLSIFKDDPLLHAPGEKYSYTTFGFTLLSAVVSKAAGEPFLEYVEREVFKPLGITTGGPDSPFLVIPNRTSFYMNGPNNQILNAPFVNPSYKWGGGGMLMTAEDLARFGNGHLGEGFLKPSTLTEMFESQKTKSGTATGVGLTWRIAKGYFGNTIYHHEGSMHGTRSALLIYPEKDISVAYMTNFSGTPGFGFQTAQLIAEPFLGETEKRQIDPTGEFDVTGTALRREVSGSLKVERKGNGYTGAFVFGSSRLEVIGAIPAKQGYFLIVVHRAGGLDVVPILPEGNPGGRFDFQLTAKTGSGGGD